MTDLTDLPSIDAITDGNYKLLTQYKQTNIATIITVMLNQCQALIDANDDSYMLRQLDNAFGQQLNYIGELIGQPRIIIDANIYNYFGFQGSTLAGTFGTLKDQSVGGIFRSVNDESSGNYYLTDSAYKRVLRAKIQRNYTDCSGDDIISSIRIIMNTDALIDIYTSGGYEFLDKDYGILNKEISLNDFTIKTVFTKSDDTSNIIIGTNSKFYMHDTSVYLTIGSQTIEWDDILLETVENYCVELSRENDVISLTINNQKQESKTICYDAFGVRYIGSYNSIIMKTLIINDEIFLFDTNTSSISSYSNRYTITIKAYDYANWHQLYTDYTIIVYENLDDNNKILLSELNLIPKPVGKSVAYYDAKGAFS